MKQIKLFAMSVVALAFLFTSCSGNPDMTKEEDMKKISEIIEKELPEGAMVTSVSLSPLKSDGFSTEARLVNVYYFDAEDNEHTLAIFPAGDIEPKDDVKGKRKTPKGTKNIKGRSIKDYDFSQITKNINAAATEVIAKEYTYSGLGSYTITFYQNPEEDTHDFSIQSKVANSTQVQGRRITTQYYEFDCKADAAGNVKVDLGE